MVLGRFRLPPQEQTKMNMTIGTFPAWNPQFGTRSKINCIDKKIAFKSFRNSSSAFVAKKSVRNIVFGRDNNKCVYCGCEDNLTVDHTISVMKCFQEERFIYCNTKANLQTLCKSCNCSKLP